VSRPSGATIASIDRSGKINLPRHAAERLEWRRVDSSIECWLWAIQLGRYRLLCEEDVKRSDVLSPALERITSLEVPDQLQDPAEPESSALAAVSARLAPASLSFNKVSGWRLAVPKHAYLMSTMVAHGHVAVLFSEGYLEIWTTETLNPTSTLASMRCRICNKLRFHSVTMERGRAKFSPVS
jgi:hypothetical protein